MITGLSSQYLCNVSCCGGSKLHYLTQKTLFLSKTWVCPPGPLFIWAPMAHVPPAQPLVQEQCHPTAASQKPAGIRDYGELGRNSDGHRIH